MAEQQNRFSTNSFRSQQSIEALQSEVFAPTQNSTMPAAEEEGEHADGPVLVQEEDLQSEVDCPGGECQLNRNSSAEVGSVTRVSLNLSRQSSQQHEQPTIVVVEEAMPEEYQQHHQVQLAEEVATEIQFHEPIQNSMPPQQQEVRPVSNVSMENEKNAVRQPRPASLVSAQGRQFMEEQKAGESPSSGGPNVEEKMLAQIRAKKNVANLIAKFNTANVVEEAKENGNAGGGGGANANKDKNLADNGGGAVNIKAMRQKFSQK